MGEIRHSDKNASENLIKRTFSGVTFGSIIGSRCCPGILLAGLQAEVAAIIFSPASLPDVANFAWKSEAFQTMNFLSCRDDKKMLICESVKLSGEYEEFLTADLAFHPWAGLSATRGLKVRVKKC